MHTKSVWKSTKDMCVCKVNIWRNVSRKRESGPIWKRLLLLDLRMWAKYWGQRECVPNYSTNERPEQNFSRWVKQQQQQHIRHVLEAEGPFHSTGNISLRSVWGTAVNYWQLFTQQVVTVGKSDFRLPWTGTNKLSLYWGTSSGRTFTSHNL